MIQAPYMNLARRDAAVMPLAPQQAGNTPEQQAEDAADGAERPVDGVFVFQELSEMRTTMGQHANSCGGPPWA